MAQALKTLLESQSVAYDFSFYSLPIPADVPVLVLSERTSLLQASIGVSLPLNPTGQLGMDHDRFRSRQPIRVHHMGS